MFLSCSPQYKLRSHLNELFAFFPGLCFLENKRIPTLTDINQTVGCRIDSEDFQKLCVEMCKIPFKSLKITHLREIILFKELKVFKSKFLLLQTGKFYQVIFPFPREWAPLMCHIIIILFVDKITYMQIYYYRLCGIMSSIFSTWPNVMCTDLFVLKHWWVVLMGVPTTIGTNWLHGSICCGWSIGWLFGSVCG